MQHYLRFYIKFHSYVIAVATIIGSIFLAAVLYQSTDFLYPLEEFYDYRYMGSVGLVFGVIWLTVGISLFYGIFKEEKKFVYPFVAMYMIELFLLVLRDIIMIWQNKRWYNMVFVNPFGVVMALYVTLHVMMTMIAMGKLIEHEPVAQPGTNFVRFNTENGQEQRHSVVGDEEVLVTD
ncbi:AAEL001325-PA [Aedes aegypti]|uniref:AAEL001325-PA n=2 Tax=Aedes aegypti TaxID=7159 RepID=A0A1S4EYE9_AEDAE|nr:uncharacterized protein LOC5570083 [Aedes aegypti]EAT47558.1 AAEL001325-PA [Aedes aegypti]